MLYLNRFLLNCLVLVSFFALFIPNCSVAQNQESITLHLIGDSTMSDKPGSAEDNPERGWGQLLPTLLNKQVVVMNHAANGRSSKSFISEGLWQKVLNLIRPGDYVIIQFGHNDQKYKDPKRYTNPWSTYRQNLQKYIDETIKLNAHPIICSPIVRRKFNEFGTLVDTHGAYAFSARNVAKDSSIPFIDMQLLTENFINELGMEKSKEIYLWLKPNEYSRYKEGKKDDTHLSLYGAREYAKLFLESADRLNIPIAKFKYF